MQEKCDLFHKLYREWRYRHEPKYKENKYRKKHFKDVGVKEVIKKHGMNLKEMLWKFATKMILSPKDLTFNERMKNIFANIWIVMCQRWCDSNI